MEKYLHGKVRGTFQYSIIQQQVHGTYDNNYTLISPTVVLGPIGSSMGYTLNHFCWGTPQG